MDEANLCGCQWCVQLARAVQESRIAKGATSYRRHRVELDLQRLRLRQIGIDQHYDAGARRSHIGRIEADECRRWTARRGQSAGFTGYSEGSDPVDQRAGSADVVSQIDT